MDWADDVAYSVHDVEDGVHAGHVPLAGCWPTRTSGRRSARRRAGRVLRRSRRPTWPTVLDELLAAAGAARRWPATTARRGAQVALKRATSELTGRFVAAAVAATRAVAGAGPLRRYAADLVVPRRIAAECALLKGVARATSCAAGQAAVLQTRQREVARRAGRGARRPRAGRARPGVRAADWLAAADDAARLRVVDRPGRRPHRPVRAGAGTARLLTTPLIPRRTPVDPFVIVGAGLAGAKAAETLRAEGFDGPLVLIGDENERPYERPPLSKGYLLGKDAREKAFVHPADWYAEHDVDLRLGTPVTALRPGRARRSTLAGGERVRYDKLLLATGSVVRAAGRARRRLTGVRYLRTLADADALRAAFAPGARVVVVGAGWIGLEVAAAAREHGAEVTAGRGRPAAAAPGPRRRDRPRSSPTCTASTASTCGFGAGVAGDHGDRRRSCSPTARSVPADAVVVGVGIRPDTGWPQTRRAGGRQRHPGRRVAAHLATRTSTRPATSPTSTTRCSGERIRVEHWANALNGGPAAARSMLGQDVSLRPGAVLLHRPVRPRHGVLRLGAARRYDQVVFRGDLAGAASSSRSGWPAAGSWPA